MKIRNGFVSNSSSTSFAIACKKNEYPKVEINLVEDLDQFAEVVIETLDELRVYFNDAYSYLSNNPDEKESFDELYQKYLDAIESGEKIYIVSVSNDGGNSVELYLYNNNIQEDMLTSGRVLDSEN